ncbi:MAG: cytochrome C oxidase subunit II [Chloroflexi bacterium]|nr:cytochrome C oxidase subunit II [Chloroflexota bacterium]
MAIYPPERIWWKPLGREERLWVTVAALWCFFMFFMLIGWYFLGAQNLPTRAQRIAVAKQWQWTPILELENNKTYTLHVSSLDVQHGLSIQPINLNLQIFPGYDYMITITPNKAGNYSLWCNEFCSIGHHLMTGKIVVK